MQKQSVDWPTVGRFGMGGLVTGAGTAALLNLVRYIRDMQKDRKDREIPADTSEDTIVVDLPHKAAAVKPKLTTTNTKTLIGPKTSSQHRRMDGTVGPSTIGTKLAAGWPTLTLSAIAGLGGGTLGAMLVNKIYQDKRHKQLEDELKATQEQYMSNLPMKQADGNVFGYVNYPLAAMAILGLVGTGGAAYITKRVLDEKLRAASEEGLEIPKVKRIVFRTKPEERAPEKIASADDIECVKAALGVMLDRLDSTSKVLNMGYVKLAMDKANTCALTLLKEASDVDTLMEHLQNTPDLRRMIVRASMENHPMLRHFKWAYDVPGLQGMADKKLYQHFGDAFKPQMQNTARMIGGSEGHVNMAEAKQADFTGSALAGMVGSAISGQNARHELVDALAEAEKKIEMDRQHKKRLPPDEMASGVQLEAQDPEAQAYLAANKQKVVRVLKNLAASGKL